MRKLRKTTSILAVSIASFSLGSCSNVERGGISSGGNHPDSDDKGKKQSSSPFGSATDKTDHVATSSIGAGAGAGATTSAGMDRFHTVKNAAPNGSKPLPICQTPVQGGSCSIYANAVIVRIGTSSPESKQIVFTAKVKSAVDAVTAITTTGTVETAPISSSDTAWCQFKAVEGKIWQVTSLTGDLAEFVTTNCGPKASQ